MQKNKPATQLQTEMANYFEKNVNAGALIRWITSIQSEGPLEAAEHDFVTHIGWNFLPDLITVRDSKERISFLETELPNLFNVTGYKGTKEALSQIGCRFLTVNTELTGDKKLTLEFMQILCSFLYITEIYGQYASLILKKEAA